MPLPPPLSHPPAPLPPMPAIRWQGQLRMDVGPWVPGCAPMVLPPRGLLADRVAPVLRTALLRRFAAVAPGVELTVRFRWLHEAERGALELAPCSAFPRWEDGAVLRRNLAAVVARALREDALWLGIVQEALRERSGGMLEWAVRRFETATLREDRNARLRHPGLLRLVEDPQWLTQWPRWVLLRSWDRVRADRWLPTLLRYADLAEHDIANASLRQEAAADLTAEAVLHRLRARHLLALTPPDLRPLLSHPSPEFRTLAGRLAGRMPTATRPTGRRRP